MKVGKAKVAFKAPPQAIIRPTGRASVVGKGMVMASEGSFGRLAKHSSAQRGDGMPRGHDPAALLEDGDLSRSDQVLGDSFCLRITAIINSSGEV